MNEIGDNSKGEEARTSGLAVAALVCVVLAVACASIRAGYDRAHIQAFSALLGLVGYLSLLAAPILGVAAISQIGRSSDVLRGKGLAIAAISIAALVILLGVFVSQARRPRSVAIRNVCGTNLKGLQTALSAYARDYGGRYPPADKWCDLLIQRCKVTPEQFVCDHGDAIPGESSYAMSKNADGKRSSELPADMVVLFETDFGKDPAGRKELLQNREWYKSPGRLGDRLTSKYRGSKKVYKLRWNQSGGADILSTQGHKVGGCNILFNDGSIKFVRAGQLGELKWEVEQARP